MSDAVEVVLTDWYVGDLATLPDRDRVRVERKLRMLPKKKWSESLADGSVAPLKDGIYEVRVLGRGAAYRVLFFIVPGRVPRLVVMTACIAKSVMNKRASLNAEIARAKTRQARWLQEQEMDR